MRLCEKRLFTLAYKTSRPRIGAENTDSGGSAFCRAAFFILWWKSVFIGGFREIE
jgi:hypothetical protein